MFIAINILPSTEVHAKKKYYFNSYMTGFNTDVACSSLSDIVMLTRIIRAEAGNQDYIGKQLVADTVLNRCDGAYQRAAYEYTEEDFTAGYYNPYCVPMYVHGDRYFGR